MNMLQILEKKKLGMELTKEEITFFAQGAADGSIPDYQLSALLMAIRLNGMSDRETTDLTLAMRDSGDIADLSSIPGTKVDKHSTGGVGDTTTLVLAPLVAACGAPVVKMSGRGLGHTGGTLDKLEAIPGMRIRLTEEEIIRQVQEIGVAVVGQTGSLAPADKVLYGLRDVTATALLHNLDESIALAQSMVRVGELAGKPMVALVSEMEQPLGTHVGNALEVKEAIDILSGRTGGALLEISLILGGLMLMLAGKAETMEAGQEMMKQAITSGAGLEKLRQMIAAQGGDPRVCDDVKLLPQAKVVRPVLCGVSGCVRQMDAMSLGLAAQAMGAGRMKVDDQLDYSVGFILKVRIGDQVEKDSPLCEIHARSQEDADRAEASIRAAISIGPEAVGPLKDYIALVTKEGVCWTEDRS